MKPHRIITLLIFISLSANAQSVSTLIGARAAAMGYACATLKDEWALFNNPAGSANIETTTLVSAYEVNPALEGAHRKAAGIMLPVSFGVAGIGMFRFGDALYNEQVVKAGLSNTFGITSLGVTFNYIQYHADGGPVRNTWSISFGGVTQITPQISVGASIVNLNQSFISQTERLPTRVSAAISFKPDDNFIVATEIEKDLGYNATWKTGIEYLIYKKIAMRWGANLNPAAIFFGTGCKTRSLSMDYAITFNRYTGGAHQVSASFRINKPSGK